MKLGFKEKKNATSVITDYQEHPDLNTNREFFKGEMVKLTGGNKDLDAVYPNGVRIWIGSSNAGKDDLGWFGFQVHANPVRLNVNQRCYQESFRKTRDAYLAIASDYNRKKQNSEYQIYSEGE